MIRRIKIITFSGTESLNWELYFHSEEVTLFSFLPLSEVLVKISIAPLLSLICPFEERPLISLLNKISFFVRIVSLNEVLSSSPMFPLSPEALNPILLTLLN